MQKFSSVQYILFAVILLGLFLRFYDLGSEYGFSDEQLSMVSTIKIARQDLQSGLLFFQEHPPLGKWLIGLPVRFIDADYSPLRFLGPNMFAWAPLAYDALAKNFQAIRIANAFFGGVLSLLFIYLIVKMLWGFDAALWSTALAAVSFDLIFMSRHDNLMKILAISLVLGTLYFYLRYVQEKNQERKYAFLGAMLIFLTFALGSRSFDPLFVLPTLVISQFYLRRSKEEMQENILFVALLAVSFYFVFFYIYPAEARAFAQAHLDAQGPLALVGFTLFPVIKNLLTRNSYLFSAVFLLIAASFAYFAKQKKEHAFFVDFVTPVRARGVQSVAIIFFLVSFFCISLTRLGGGTYDISIFSGVFLLAGPILQKVAQYKHLKFVLLFLLVANSAQLVYGFPYNIWEYSNFGAGRKLGSIVIEHDLPNEVFQVLGERQNPFLLSNTVNTLLFYKGERMPIIIPGESRCDPKIFAELKKIKAHVLITSGDVADQYICPLFKEANLTLIKDFSGFAEVRWKLYSF